MTSLAKTISIILILCIVAFSCSDTHKTCTQSDKIKVAPINPNGDSELALLMREMYEELDLIKKQLDKGEAAKIDIDHKALLTAHGTEPEKVGSDAYKAFAQTYLNALEHLKDTEADNQEEAFNLLVNNCMTCHKALCPGPMVKIKKLR